MKHLRLRTLVSLLLLTILLPQASSVAAQRFSNLSTQNSSTIDYILDAVVSEDTVQNDDFMTLYPDFVSLTQNFIFHDIYLEEASGSTVEDALNFFETATEPTYNELEPGESYLSYLLFTEDNTNAAEILLYYIDDEMYYAGLTNLDLDLSAGIIDEELLIEWVSQEASIEEVAAATPRVAGMSHVQYNGEFFQILMIPTSDVEGNLMIDFMVIYNGQVFDSYPVELNEALSAPQDYMINTFVSYFNPE